MDLFPTAAAMGAFSLLKEYALSAQPTAIFLSRKASQYCLVIYSACMAPQCCSCRQRQTQDEALPENFKSRKSPRSHTNGCKTVHSLLTPEEKQQLLVVHRLHGTFKLKNPEMSGESFQMLWKWMWFYTQNIENFILWGLPASLTTVARQTCSRSDFSIRQGANLSHVFRLVSSEANMHRSAQYAIKTVINTGIRHSCKERTDYIIFNN